MNNNGDSLLRLLVPAAMLIFWALGQIYNRQAAAANKSRNPVGVGNRLGPRPGALPPARSPGLVVRPSTPLPPPPRPAGSPAGSARGSKNRMEGVLAVERHDPFAQATAILEGSAPSKRANAATATRKKNEAAARAARTQAEKQFQAAPGSALGGGGVGSSKVSESAHRPMIVDLQPAVSLEIMRNSLADPQRIREAFLLQTILDVPVSLRRPPQGPRRAV